LSFNVLIVEDEPIPATFLKKIIEDNQNFKVVDIVNNANDALKILREKEIDVICLDIILKGHKDGATLSVEIRDIYPNIEILFLTAYSEEEMLEFAAEAKASAYLLKPYRPEEIKATFRLLETKLKRDFTKETRVSNIVNLIDGYYFNIEKEALFFNDKEVKLGKKELEFLAILSKNRDITVDSETILTQLNISEISLRSIIYRIRKATTKDLIISVKKYGYKIATP